MNRFSKSKGTGVVLKENENINQALRRFKKKIEEAGTLDTLRAKEFYEKPTTAKKRQRSAAKNRWQQKQRAQELPKKLY